MNYGYTPDPGERTLRVVHRSVITLVPPFGAALGLIILAAFFSYITGNPPSSVPHAAGLTAILAVIFIALAVIIVLVALFVFRRNVLIFTNIHLINAEQIGLFNHRISQINFGRVQDVSGNKVGIWQTIFNFGNVEVQSAGEQEKFIFPGAPNPQEVADDALQTRDNCMHDAAAAAGLGANVPAAPSAPAAPPTPDAMASVEADDEE